MRRFTKLLITSLLIGCAIVACSKDQTYSLKVPSESILVSMPGDTGSTNFDSQNITSITVTSTPEGWTVDNIDISPMLQRHVIVLTHTLVARRHSSIPSISH